MNKIKWQMDKVHVIDCTLRMKRTISDDFPQMYAVIKVSFSDSWDTYSFTRIHKRYKTKYLTLMCFEESLFQEIMGIIKRCFEQDGFAPTMSFEGFVSFGYGNTYLVIEEMREVKDE